MCYRVDVVSRKKGKVIQSAMCVIGGVCVARKKYVEWMQVDLEKKRGDEACSILVCVKKKIKGTNKNMYTM